MSDHERLREWAAAYVLDALEVSERREFESHLDTCGVCRSEVASMAPLPALLARVDADAVEVAPASIADRATAQVRSDWLSLSRSRRRWQLATVAAAVAAVIVLAWPAASPNPSGTLLVAEPGIVSAVDVVLEARGWGTEVGISLEGVPARDRYVAWAVDAGGQREVVATWGPTGTGSMRVTGASSFPTDALAEIQIVGDGEEDVLVVARSSA